MSPRIITVIKFEYLQTIKRIGFWIGTLFFPIFLALVMAVSAWSSMTATESSEKILNSGEQIIVIVDEAKALNPDILTGNYQAQTDLLSQIERVKQNEIRAVFYLPNDFVATKNYQIYAQDQGVFTNFSYSAMLDRLISISIASQITNPQAQALFQTSLTAEKTEYYSSSGELVEAGVNALILPVISFIIFFMAVFISGQYLLQSVAEEKENRMIETILSVIDSKTLIFGKIIGLSLVVLTQLVVWLIGGLATILTTQNFINIGTFVDLSALWKSFTPATVSISILITFLGFLLFSAIMVGVGSVASSYKDSQSLSSVFVILAIFPIYFVTAILSDSNGLVARIFSYFPTTSAFVFLLRNSLGELDTWELTLGIVLNILYVIIAFWIAAKLFDLGILMYNRKPTLKEIWSVLWSR